MANPASARLQRVEESADNAQDTAPDQVLVHVRYQPNGEIFSIGEKPARLDASQWLKHLLDTASPYYRTLAGGRGFYCIPREKFDALIGLLPA